MKNVDIKIEGNTLILKVDLTQEQGPSSSGKTMIIGTTSGNAQIPGREEFVGLNVYRYAKPESE